MTSLAALALYDGGAEITASNINVLLSGSDNKVQPYWPGLFASLLSNRINELIYSVGGGGGGGSSAAASASSAPAGDGKLLVYSIDHIIISSILYACAPCDEPGEYYPLRSDDNECYSHFSE